MKPLGRMETTMNWEQDGGRASRVGEGGVWAGLGLCVGTGPRAGPGDPLTLHHAVKNQGACCPEASRPALHP